METRRWRVFLCLLRQKAKKLRALEELTIRFDI
jgi:hypothetical protein